MADEGKPHTKAEARIVKHEAQLAEFGSFDATNSIDFRTIPTTKDLLYLASSVYLDAIYGDGKGESFGLTNSARNVQDLEKQYGELNAEIVKIEKALEKGQATKKTEVSQKLVKPKIKASKTTLEALIPLKLIGGLKPPTC